MKPLSNFLFILLSLFVISTSYSQSSDTLRKGPMSIVLEYAGTSTYGAGYGTGTSVKYKQFMKVGDQKYKVNRKNLDPYFKQDPDAYKKWNAYYNYSYAELGFLALFVTSGVMTITSHDNNRFSYGVVAGTSVLTAILLSVIAKKKRDKAVELYNDYWEHESK
jgi:hypothetical protein